MIVFVCNPLTAQPADHSHLCSCLTILLLTRCCCCSDLEVLTSPSRTWQPSPFERAAENVLPVQDAMHGEYHCPPTIADASTHFGAMRDLERGEPARVPVALGAYSPSKPLKVDLEDTLANLAH